MRGKDNKDKEAPAAQTDLRALSEAATQGEWKVVPALDGGDMPTRIRVAGVGTVGRFNAMFGRPHAPAAQCEPNAALCAALVNAYRSGTLITSSPAGIGTAGIGGRDQV